MLIVESLSRPGLGPISLSVAEGACLAVAGPSGAGKTLLLRAIADLDPNEGRVAAAGVERAAVSAPDWRRLVGYVPTESGWWAETVRPHFPPDGAPDALLTALHLPPDCLDWPVARLSTGERQRLALARALCGEPRVLLLDEPTASLDRDARDAAEALLRARLAAGMSVLLVTHDPGQANRLADRLLRLDRGQATEATP